MLCWHFGMLADINLGSVTLFCIFSKLLNYQNILNFRFVYDKKITIQYRCIDYHMRGEVISVLSLERRYHILSRVSGAKFLRKLRTIILCHVFSLYYCIFLLLSLCRFFAIFVFSGTKNDIAGQKTISRDKKRYRGTKNDIAGQKTISRDKNDITGHIVFMSPCYRPDKGTSM